MTIRKDASTDSDCRLRVCDQRGFSLVSAIFLLIVLAGLGAAIVNISMTQHTGSALDVQGTRAYQAARAGIEWGLFQQLQAGGACNNSTSFVPPAPTLSAFTVTVVCTSVVDPNTNPPVTTFRIESTACNQPDAGGDCPGSAGGTYYVERQLRVRGGGI